MLRLIATIFVLGLITITLAQDDETSTDYSTELSSIADSSAPFEATTVPSELTSWFDGTITTNSILPHTQQPMTTPAPVIFTTQQQPFKPLFQCDFNSPCFGNNQLTITDGSQFNPDDLGDRTEPPRAPTSDVTSITTPTNNNQMCKLPYKPSLSNGTGVVNWDMYFCYNKQCETTNGQTATCAPGSYGLVSIDPSESSKTVIDSLSPNTVLRDAVGEQCLRFYYYMTVYSGQDWGQQIQLWIRPDNQTDNQFSIGNITATDMQNNSWNFREITFNSAFSNYTLFMLFQVTLENRTEIAGSNETINFALDNMELYDYNCSYVKDQLITSTPGSTTSTPAVTTLTTTTDPAATPSTTTAKSKNLGLILGLSLGIGIPVLAAIIGGLVYYFCCRKPKVHPTQNKTDTIGAVTNIPLVPTKPTNNNVAAVTDTPSRPIPTTNDNSTIAAVVV